MSRLRLQRWFARASIWILLVVLPSGHAEDRITIMGSDTLVILARQWAAEYMRSHPQTKIQVTGGGTGVGLAALQNQITDLASASRAIKPREKIGCIKAFGKQPTEYPVCLDGVSIYVNPSNPIESITIPQLAGIFSGRIRNWKELGGRDQSITVYSRENNSGTYEFFKKAVLEGMDFAPSTQTLPGTAAVLQAVIRDDSGIGYGGAAYASGTRTLKVARSAGGVALAPSESNVLDGSYPFSRYLFIYVNPDLDNGSISRFLQWVRSPDGQRIVHDVGYYPLPRNPPPAR